MAEEKKLGFLMRGAEDELFAERVRKLPKTITEFVSEASTIEKARDTLLAWALRSILTARGKRQMAYTSLSAQ